MHAMRVVVRCRIRMKYNCQVADDADDELWFGVELGWNTTVEYRIGSSSSCGLRG